MRPTRSTRTDTLLPHPTLFRSMLQNPAQKYRPFAPFQLADRQWPNRSLNKPPIWMSTDLRDGNQSLFEPMNAERKMRMFRMLCDIGFKEIEDRKSTRLNSSH